MPNEPRTKTQPTEPLEPVLSLHPPPKSLRLNLDAVNRSLLEVENAWPLIDDELDKRQIGRRDTPFDAVVRERMLSAYAHIDSLLEQRIPPFSTEGMLEMFVLNNRIHYGTDRYLMHEYRKAIDATYEKFQVQILPLKKWYDRHELDHPIKLSAEIYVGILGFPQLFIEGNHRCGVLIGDWINMYFGYPPFVLSPENAAAYFEPSSEIKRFTHKSTWRGRNRIPKYHRVFREFWETHIDKKYIQKSIPKTPDLTHLENFEVVETVNGELIK